MKIILLGPPGSGKGTLAEKLEKEFHLLHVSAGEILREEAKKNISQGKNFKSIMEKGNLVPDELTTALVKAKIRNQPQFILDGFPRNLIQAELMKDIAVDVVLLLDVPEKVVVERLSGRRVCQKGIHNYHIRYVRPKKEGICDIDKIPLIQRGDDNPAAIKKRYQIYQQKTKPLINYYTKKKLLKTVKAAQSPEEVYKDVKKILKNA